MLILTRHENEPTVLFRADGTIIGHVTPTLIKGSKVRLAFDFPPEVLIGRGQVPVMPEKGNPRGNPVGKNPPVELTAEVLSGIFYARSVRPH